MGLHIFLCRSERAWIEENCELGGTDNVQGQTSKHTHIFTLKCAHSFENIREMSFGYTPVLPEAYLAT